MAGIERSRGMEGWFDPPSHRVGWLHSTDVGAYRCNAGRLGLLVPQPCGLHRTDWGCTWDTKMTRFAILGVLHSTFGAELD